MKRNKGDICPTCNKNTIHTKNKNKKTGKIYYGRECYQCNCLRYKIYTKTYKIYHIYKKEICEKCGFIPIKSCQLDVHHIDGNNSHNDISNLQTLCANCHRLENKNCKLNLLLLI